MRKLAIVVALFMLSTALPVATANHLSVGTQATVGHGMNLESPDSPSVAGDVVGDENTPYGLGTSQNCNEITGQPGPQDVVDAATQEGWCGELVYNKGFPGLQKVGPTDQQILDDAISVFDVQRSFDTVVFAGGCEPFCRDDPGGDEAWNAVHTVGSAAGVTDGTGTADDKENTDRDQNRRTDLLAATATTFLQRNTGVWEMNGWTTPYPFEEWVGVVKGPGFSGPDNTMTPQDLEDLVKPRIGGELSADTIPQFCGFTPDAEFIGTASSAGCEFKMEYVGPTEDDSATSTDFDGYENGCNTPSYVCAPSQGAFWRAQFTGVAGSYGGAQTNYGDLTVDEGTPWEDTTGQAEQFAVHWMIAPNPPDCAAAEPRFDFEADGGTLPYLAHDLDVYTTLTETSNGPQVSAEGATDTYTAVLTDTLGTGLPVPEGTTDQLNQVSPLFKANAQEPNYADTVAGAEENSQSEVTIPRGAPGECLQRIIGGTDETQETRDDWVNVLDAQVSGQADVSSEGVPFFGLDTDLFVTADAYGTTDQDQDASNRPGPGLYSTDGKVGVFADKDDDGYYDQAVGPADAPSTFGQTVWSPQEIADVGAYPMVWGVKVEEGQINNPSIDNDAGCDLTASTTLSEAAGDAGYGANTGLVQAIYLREPTAFVDADSPEQAAPYPLGNNIYVLPSNAGHELWTSDDLTDGVNPMDEKIDDFVQNFRTHIEQNFDVSATPDVQRPVQDLGLDSAFFDQCAESTGGFDSQVSFLHACRGAGPASCEGDTVATMYTYELDSDADTINGPDVPPLEYTPATGGERVNFQGFNGGDWFDIDPLDNDPARSS